MPSGGPQTGTPGVNYGNRTDLQSPISAAPGQQYGAAAAQTEAQHVVPMAGPQPQGVEPGSLTALNAPTERPNEPVTHGVSSGLGGGPEVLGMANDDLARLKAMYDQYPSRDLLRLIYAAATS